MKDKLPVFDQKICIRCGGCEEFCPASAIGVKNMGYKVVVGGSGARHPHIADTVTECTDLEGVLSILEKTIALVRSNAKRPMRVLTLRKLIADRGVDQVRG